MTVQTINNTQSIFVDPGPFTGSGDGAYDLGPAGYLKLFASVLVQDNTASTLKGVHTEATTGQPQLWIEAGESLTVQALGAAEVGYGFYSDSVASGVKNDGTLSVSATGNAIGVALKAGGVLINNVTLTVTSSGGQSYGVVAGDDVGGVTTIANSGTITANYAIFAADGVHNPGHLLIGNAGTINGNIVLGAAAGNELDNYHAINGHVIFNGLTGSQTYNGQDGTLSGDITFAANATGGIDYAYLGNDGETVYGGGANLSAFGGSGDDHITGGAGNDIIAGGAGHNVLNGGAGNNTINYYPATSGVTVSLALQGQAQNTGGGGIDTLSNFQNIVGSKYDDHLTGDDNDNVINVGGGGNDVLSGGAGGFDTVSFSTAASGVTVSLALQGQTQNTGVGTDILSNFQQLIGSAFNDTLEGGGSPVSYLSGGAGADTFVFKSNDGGVAILDFSHAQGDKIDLSALPFGSLSDVLDVAYQSGSDTYIPIGGADVVKLAGVSLASLTAADFSFSPGPTVGPGIGGTPTTGSGTLTGGAGSDWLQGQGGNDTLHGGAGPDYLDGGAGLNTATYDGVYRQYGVGAGGATVSGGPEGGTDDLVNIQRIQFVDGYLATGTTDTAGQVYRLYEATLGRAPDPEGLANWVHALNSGTSLQTVVNGFVNSTEFQQTYGTLDNPAFVTLLYNNVLHRAPDTAGLNNWVALLNSGHSRAEVVTGFSESPEDIAALAAPVQQGLWIQDAAAAETFRLYDAVLGRLPDAGGLANWTHMLESGTSLQTVANGFVGSAEFQQVYGALNDTGFVTLLYNNVLHRAPDTAGLNNWLSYISQGHSRAEVVLGFSESPEHVQNTAAHVDQGIWLAG